MDSTPAGLGPGGDGPGCGPGGPGGDGVGAYFGTTALKRRHSSLNSAFEAASAVLLFFVCSFRASGGTMLPAAVDQDAATNAKGGLCPPPLVDSVAPLTMVVPSMAALYVALPSVSVSALPGATLMLRLNHWFGLVGALRLPL